MADVMNWLRQAKTADDRRKSFPAEHLLTAGLGMWLVSSANRKSSFLGRTVRRSLGMALLARAASGRDGLARLKR